MLNPLATAAEVASPLASPFHSEKNSEHSPASSHQGKGIGASTSAYAAASASGVTCRELQAQAPWTTLGHSQAAIRCRESRLLGSDRVKAWASSPFAAYPSGPLGGVISLNAVKGESTSEFQPCQSRPRKECSTYIAIHRTKVSRSGIRLETKTRSSTCSKAPSTIDSDVNGA